MARTAWSRASTRNRSSSHPWRLQDLLEGEPAAGRAGGGLLDTVLGLVLDERLRAGRPRRVDERRERTVADDADGLAFLQFLDLLAQVSSELVSVSNSLAVLAKSSSAAAAA